eukprot:jgi/Chrpa1/23529/Chrysochromulina_OHIO_Genome00000700-RA
MHFLLVALSATFPDALGSIHPPLYPLERLGTHIILEVIDAPFALLNSSTKQLAALQAAAIAGGLTIVGQLVHQFPIMGASTILLISESHLSIHAWPERGYASVDLFTCGPAQLLPCRQHEPAHFESGAGWTCASGAQVANDLESGLWMAVQTLLRLLQAQGAMLTWMDRGLPNDRGKLQRRSARRLEKADEATNKAAAATLASPPPPEGFGWLGGLEREDTVEL